MKSPKRLHNLHKSISGNQLAEPNILGFGSPWELPGAALNPVVATNICLRFRQESLTPKFSYKPSSRARKCISAQKNGATKTCRQRHDRCTRFSYVLPSSDCSSRRCSSCAISRLRSSALSRTSFGSSSCFSLVQHKRS